VTAHPALKRRLCQAPGEVSEHPTFSTFPCAPPRRLRAIRDDFRTTAAVSARAHHARSAGIGRAGHRAGGSGNAKQKEVAKRGDRDETWRLFFTFPMKKLVSTLALSVLATAAFGFDAVLTDDATLTLSGKPANLGAKPLLTVHASHAALLKFDAQRKDRFPHL
jgi:hypothetical protein